MQINILEYLKKTVKNFPQKIATSASCGVGVNLSFYRYGKIISSKSINKINDLLLCAA